MQLSVYDAMTQLNIIRTIITKLENDEPIDDYLDEILTVLRSYSEIVKNAKININ